MHMNRRHRDLKRSNARRENDAFFVMILFDGGSDKAGNANTITTHHHRHRCPFVIEHGSLHRFAVFGAELKDMPDFDAAFNFKRAVAVRARISRYDIAQIGELRLR